MSKKKKKKTALVKKKQACYLDNVEFLNQVDKVIRELCDLSSKCIGMLSTDKAQALAESIASLLSARAAFTDTDN